MNDATYLVESDLGIVADDRGQWRAVCDLTDSVAGEGDTEVGAMNDLCEKLTAFMNDRVLH